MAFRGDTLTSSSSSSNTKSFLLLTTLAALALSVEFAVATADAALPHLCDNVRCPPLEDITCPADSDVRESIMPIAAALMQPLNPDDEEALAVPPHLEPSYNSSEIIDEELYTQCCVAKKCLCRTCYIPDCHEEHEVIYELTPESMDTPGKCCGTYQCRPEPNCNEVRDTESYWMTNCQRCKCFSGERICHQSCDEGVKGGSMAICNSKSLNRFFRHGESWKDGCYECDCVNGEEKCVMSFCRSVNCPPSRQVMLKDSCCPICWPANITMPNAQDAEYSEEPMAVNNAIYDDEDEEGEEGEELPIDTVASENAAELDLLPNLVLNSEEKSEASTTTTTATALNTTTMTPPAANIAVLLDTTTAASNTTTTSTSTSTSTTTTTPRPTTTTSTMTPTASLPKTTAKTTAVPAFIAIVATTEAPITHPTTAAPPCELHNRQDAPPTYQVYPEVVEVVCQNNHLNYAVIGVLVFIIVILIVWNYKLHSKNRSYRPVTTIDDNFNKMSSNIKKMNEFV